MNAFEQGVQFAYLNYVKLPLHPLHILIGTCLLRVT
jgi:hypothetical protein